MTPLATILQRLVDNESLRSHGEEGTRQVAILPVLASLGWDRDDLDEVEPEHPVGNGRVDYCLRHGNRNCVFIEVKRTGTDLDPHQQQLLSYAFQEGVPLAALTDGLIWWLYLPTEVGSWEQRKFFTVDCTAQDPADAAQSLQSYLQRAAVIDQSAQQRAIAELQGQQRNQRIQAVLPDVWEKLLSDPDDQLHELVSEAVEGAAGHRPDPEIVAAFLLKNSQPSVPWSLPSQPPPAGETRRRRRKKPKSLTGRKPVAFILNGQRVAVSQWRQLIVETCNLLAVLSGPSFEQKVLLIRGTKRPYFSRDPNPLREPVPLAGNLFFDGLLNANSSDRFVRRVVHAVLGPDAVFEIELAQEN